MSQTGVTFQLMNEEKIYTLQTSPQSPYVSNKDEKILLSSPCQSSIAIIHRFS